MARRPFRSWPLLLVLAGLGLLQGTREGSAQEVKVQGRVVEELQESWVGGATVRLSGLRPYITDLDGLFSFSGVRQGRHTLTVEALGYRTRSMELVLTSDTTLMVEMDPDPIVLDSLLVRAGRITIRGRITDATEPDRIPFAQVTVLPGFPTVGAVSGRFTIRGVPVGRAVTVLVESVGYYPAPIALITEADTTLYVALEPDPVGMLMLAQQAEKLSVRSRSVPYALQSLDREELDRRPGWTAFDVVNSRLRMRGRRGRTLNPNGEHRCLFVDDVNHRFPAFLFGFTADEVERIEIYDGGGMIRVYTKQYLVSLMGREPPTVVYIKGGLGGPVCR